MLSEGLVKLVEETIRSEHACSPNKPIYLVGDSFGGCLALAVASRNPKIDLVLILANPGWFHICSLTSSSCDHVTWLGHALFNKSDSFFGLLLATSFGRSQLQPLFPLLEAMPDVLHQTVPYLLSFVMGK